VEVSHGKIRVRHYFSENNVDLGVRINGISESISLDETSLHSNDADIILRLMPNRRYSQLIRLRYLEGHSNEETAQLMGMNMNTFYNKHKMAKAQYIKILKQEEYDG